VLGERPRENRGELEVAEVVTGCDHLGAFGLRELESKVRREAFGVTFDRLIENFGRDAVDQCKIAVQQYLFTADRQHARLDHCERERVCGTTYTLGRHWGLPHHPTSIPQRVINTRIDPLEALRYE
jgi:hypothetical protein